MKIEIYFKSKADAQMTINEAVDIAKLYGFVTLADIYDIVGLAMCIAKKALGNKGNFNDIFKKWIPEESEESKVFWEEWSKNMLDAFRKIY